MMRKETVAKIETLKGIVGERTFSEKETKGIISLQTLKKYGLIETCKIVEKEEVSLEELVSTINEMIGEDCYGMEGEYVVEEGKAYYVTHYYCYRFI